MTTGRRNGERALVTGGAGLIGSHLADGLLKEGYRVRILDNLEPQTHRNGKPAWVPKEAEFLHADVRDPRALRPALEDVDLVFHEAAYGGYMPGISKYVEVNSLGTARLLETIRDENLPIRKLVVASSQAVYREGAGLCAQHGLVFPESRPVEDLARGDYAVRCPKLRCGEPAQPTTTPEEAPTGGETVYAITKAEGEKLALTWGRATGIPTVALRYSCTYGPRQSIFNPYTGVIAIFATRLLNGRPPVLYEDGEQTRDFCYVEDVARANLLAAATDALDGSAVNVGSGRATTIRRVAQTVAAALGVAIEPVARGEYRPGEMRHLTSDVSRIRAAGHTPRVDLETGIERYLDWIATQGDVRDYFAAAEEVLREKRIVHRAAAAPRAVR
ncbi:NAD-dependent epimerase/dehydratase family protein [Rubrobacter marinus]|uniref:NAD-dependent epimerase/dehydratase family protein n=1 Tax=Rubrobacter marinus TaxID=2653852 RepID=A0A6G8PSQ8_9ACTN|nr:NAD-dependent epimerase/dehydratase family protein [Rubrobacter marinus]QIN77470.1 NAD-dependent epimerase/dehydratase family protein [Rubrobacter marinus]